MEYNNNKPINLNLFRFHFPITAVVSMGHRMSGVLLFLAIPILVYLLDLSLRDEQSFISVQMFFTNGWVQLVSFILIWGFTHHLIAGIRHLLIDANIGCKKTTALNSAWGVLLIELLVVFMIGGFLIV